MKNLTSPTSPIHPDIRKNGDVSDLKNSYFPLIKIEKSSLYKIYITSGILTSYKGKVRESHITHITSIIQPRVDW